ncbi:uncharacterized protein LOC119743625 [Patiria miniata]|uniref:Uncharacterized protein n=1 Tax=Patiria miniata TaxID=46514 RepID=A0A914BIN4_PATMI|nr:uncharacterized protein LOC119743625 [Patiria miniata]XP_038075965.1 uncharacterized protein LOC119743625 [Patiria miniata]
MSQNGPMQVEMNFDLTPTNGPMSTFTPLNHSPGGGIGEDNLNDNFAIQDGDDDDNNQEASVVLEMLDDDERFGFSVMGGIEEGFLPKVDEILPGKSCLNL